jgi:hypothetical protein
MYLYWFSVFIPNVKERRKVYCNLMKIWPEIRHSMIMNHHDMEVNNIILELVYCHQLFFNHQSGFVGLFIDSV